VPSWQPNWVDVRFDHHAAAAAVDLLIATSRQFADQHQARVEQTALATVEWRGPGHDKWVEAQQQLMAEHVELGRALRDDAARIEDAALLARRDQANREVEREAWIRESAVEAAVASAVASAAAQAPMAWYPPSTWMISPVVAGNQSESSAAVVRATAT